jgi:hypothetical protein
VLIFIYCVTYFILCGRTDMLKCISSEEKLEKEADDNFQKVFDKSTDHEPQTVPLRSGSMIGDLLVEKLIDARASVARLSHGSKGNDSLNRSG